jgi:hypothetical protein
MIVGPVLSDILPSRPFRNFELAQSARLRDGVEVVSELVRRNANRAPVVFSET